MNKFFNALLFVVLIPTMILAIFVGFDVPIPILRTSGAELTYNKEVFFVLGIFILLINIRRSVRRWSAMRMVNQVSKFKWSTVVSKDRVKRIYVYNFSEAFLMTCAGLSLYLISEDTWMPFIGLFLGAADDVFFALFGAIGKKYRVGMTSKALLAGDRDVIVIYFLGLRKVSVHLQTVFFDFKDDLQLSFPLDLIPVEKRNEFFQELKETVDKTKVYFSNDL